MLCLQLFKFANLEDRNWAIEASYCSSSAIQLSMRYCAATAVTAKNPNFTDGQPAYYKASASFTIASIVP